ncbi:MAG: alpha-L-fucosidase, partial [Maribacter sp.]
MEKYSGRKLRIIAALVVVSFQFNLNAQNEVYEESWESIAKVNATPDWFLDAKLGIYAHWGPVSSAFEGTDPNKHYAGWHGMMMYNDGKIVETKNGKPSNNFIHHKKKYGKLSKKGYIEIIEDFSPTAFDAKEWATLFAKSGAKFAGPVAIHHDNFAMW